VSRGFPDLAWQEIDAIPGWLTRAQAEALQQAVADAGPAPVVVEIGSHHGRSTVVLAAARPDAVVTTIDPFITARLFPGRVVRASLLTTLNRFGVQDRVQQWTMTSRAARSQWSGVIDVLYIDGKHDYWTVSDDVLWADHVRPGGYVLIHDAFSSVGVTLALLRHVLLSPRLRYEGRTGSLARFCVAAPRRADRLAMLSAMPWWFRNVGIKVLLRLRLRHALDAVGHQGPYDPY